MLKSISTLFLFLVFPLQITLSQDYKFGKVSKEELEEKFYPSDSSANAAYLYKKRRTYTTVLANEIQLITEIQIRLKIYNKEGFDWATEKVRLYSKNQNERFTKLKAVTYNLENGKIIETKLNKKEVFDEQVSDNLKVKKFTMPNVKEGSVLEWSYTVNSKYFTQIDDIVVQYAIPVKKYEAKIELLEWFYFNKRQRGYYPFRINESSKRNHDFDTSDKVIKITEVNIPAIKEEPFINNIKNYTSALQLEVASLNAPSLMLFENYATSWEEIAKDINKNSAFGGELKKTSHLKDDINTLKSQFSTLEDKIFASFQFVKNKIKWNGNYGKYPEKGLKKSYNENTGNIGDINLTLVAMLRGMGIKSNPILVSSRSNGVPIFPTKRGFNYVIASVETNNGIVLLDASEQYSLPNVLPLRTLNWHGRIVHENGSSTSINLSPKNLSSKKGFLNVKLDQEAMATGSSKTSFNHLNALNYRNKYNHLSEQELIGKFEENYQNIEIIDFTVHNKEDINKPLTQTLTFESDNQVEIIGDNMYFSPLFYLTKKENPFKLEIRNFPVDFGAPWEEKYTVSIELPEGYTLESKPENVAFSLPDNLGSYKFISIVKGNTLQVLSNIKINNPIIASNNYGVLKEFYKKMIEKQLEKVVLVKKI